MLAWFFLSFFLVRVWFQVLVIIVWCNCRDFSCKFLVIIPFFRFARSWFIFLVLVFWLYFHVV